MNSRIDLIRSHLVKNKVSGVNLNQKSDDDVVICCALRTPLTKAKRGGLKDTPIEILSATVFRGILERTRIDPKLIGDVVMGNVLAPGSGAAPVRMGMFLAGIPDSVPCATLDRMCSSGLEAVSVISTKIKAGLIDIGIGGGVESMSQYDMNSMVDVNNLSELVYENEGARNCLLSMGQTSENVAEKFGISREVQDRFAVESHAKAARAQELGLFDSEIIPVKTITKDADENPTEITVTKDDGIRKDTTVQGLGKLKPAFKKDGSTTAGNASQVSDGAAGVLLARRSVAKKLGLPIIGRFITHAVVGVPPEIMGIGPAFAIPRALEKAGLTDSDISIYEINEAFASQASYSINKLGIDIKKVNPKGGAIAFGHPLGCTGARQIATILPELKRTGGRFGVMSMCIGTGMGAAAIIENE